MNVEKDAVVVGVDGSDKDRHTLAWAADEAVSKDVGLHVAWAFDPDRSGLSRRGSRIDVEVLGRAIIDTAVERVREAHPDHEIAAHAVADDPAKVLVEASRDAGLVVVGGRGLGRIAGRLVGSVSQKVAAHAKCPVAVVRGTRSPNGPIVVGVDPWEAHDHVLELAFDHARRRNARLRFVLGLPTAPAYIEDSSAFRALVDADTERIDDLDELADTWREKFPDVTLETAVVRKHPINALTAEAESAGLIVVGSRSPKGLAGVRLGSVARGILQEAPLVVIVPVEAERTD